MIAALNTCDRAAAAPGDFDPSFSQDGIVFASDPVGPGPISLAATSAGDVFFSDGGAPQKVNNSGELDPAFSAASKVALAPLGPQLRVFDIAADSSDRILLEASTFAPSTGAGNSYAVRLRADGVLDDTFGTGGTVALGDQSGGPIAVGTDGRIVVSGGSVVYRLTDSGDLDSSFGSGGSVTFAAAVRDLKFAARDGSVLALTDDNLTKLRPDGIADLSFGAGTGTVETSGQFGSSKSLAVSGDGRIFIQFGQCLPGGSCNSVGAQAPSRRQPRPVLLIRLQARDGGRRAEQHRAGPAGAGPDGSSGRFCQAPRRVFRRRP